MSRVFCPDRAFSGAETILAAVLEKAEFWKRHSAARINDRQRNMLDRLLDDFEDKLTSSKWATIEKCSPDTALRDIQNLVDQSILTKDGGRGRSTSYSLVSSGMRRYKQTPPQIANAPVIPQNSITINCFSTLGEIERAYREPPRLRCEQAPENRRPSVRCRA